MRKRSMVLVFVVLLVTSIFSVSENLPSIKVLWWPGPESVAMQKVCDYWNSNYSEKKDLKPKCCYLVERVGGKNDNCSPSRK